mmetsp:Transcript_99032/g.319272  ORF Transcript_99032/g.319272 Transcript_99032/m.319272 type:complete len:237 (+) Transcript_99032:117-827(+)
MSDAWKCDRPRSLDGVGDTLMAWTGRPGVIVDPNPAMYQSEDFFLGARPMRSEGGDDLIFLIRVASSEYFGQKTKQAQDPYPTPCDFSGNFADDFSDELQKPHGGFAVRLRSLTQQRFWRTTRNELKTSIVPAPGVPRSVHASDRRAEPERQREAWTSDPSCQDADGLSEDDVVSSDGRFQRTTGMAAALRLVSLAAFGSKGAPSFRSTKKQSISRAAAPPPRSGNVPEETSEGSA